MTEPGTYDVAVMRPYIQSRSQLLDRQAAVRAVVVAVIAAARRADSQGVPCQTESGERVQPLLSRLDINIEHDHPGRIHAYVVVAVTAEPLSDARLVSCGYEREGLYRRPP
jgi:hypothetical protein